MVDIRVSILPSLHGDKVVLRLLDKQVDFDLGTLLGDRRQDLDKRIQQPNGLILVK